MKARKNPLPTPPLAQARPPRRRSTLLTVFIAAFAMRLMYNAARQLVPDEAFYWVLSRHLHAGYLDHPPMVAWVIRLGTMLLGPTELGVRAIGAACAFGALLVLLTLCRRIVGQDRAVGYLAAVWLTSPLLAVLATIITPDTPSIFFSTCAMACAIRAALLTEEDDDNAAAPPTFTFWIGFGAFTGLSLLAKYTAILPAAAVVAALLTSPRGRAELRRPGVWVAAALALAIFSPVIYWNATHDWASFRYQLHHGLADTDAETSAAGWARERFTSLLGYAGGQIGAFTPVLFVFAVAVLGIAWSKYRTLSLARRVLVWSGTVPLVFFGLAAFKSGSPGEANWPAFAYFPLSLLLIDHVAAAWKRSDVVWLRVGCGVALAIALVLHMPEQLYRTGLLRDKFPRKLNEMFGWREMARSIERTAFGTFVVAGRHQDAGELSFYMRGQPDVWCYPEHDANGNLVKRPTSFDYFPERPDLKLHPRVSYVQGHVDAFCKEYGFHVVGWGSFKMNINGHSRERSIALLEQGLPEPATKPARGRKGAGRATTKPATTSTRGPTTQK